MTGEFRWSVYKRRLMLDCIFGFIFAFVQVYLVLMFLDMTGHQVISYYLTILFAVALPVVAVVRYIRMRSEFLGVRGG